MRINYYSFFLKETLKNIVRNSSITFISITLITISLFIIGLILSMSHTLKAYMGDVNSNPNMVFFIKNNAPLSDKEQFVDILKRSVHITKYEFLDKSKVKDQITDDSIKELTKLYGDEIIPQAFFVYTKIDVNKKEFHKLYNKLKEQPIVDNGFYEEEKLFIFSYLKKIGGFILIIFSFLIILIVGFAIRISIFSKSEEIYLKKLIGSTHSFILIPFAIEGILKGLLGGIFADILFFILYLTKSLFVPTDFLTTLHFITLKEVIIIPLLGGIFGWLGAVISSGIYVKH